MKKYLLYLGVTILSICSCSTTNKPVELIEAWFPWTGYLGELYAEQITDSLYNIDIKIVDGADNVNPIQLVLADKYLFGIAGAEAIIAANVNTGADLVAIGVVNYKSATCFISLPEQNVHSPQDFTNKTIGILPGTETETIYKALKQKYNLIIDPNNEIDIPNDIQTFLLNKYDIRPAFTYDEAVTLDRLGIEYHVIYPEEFGISTIGGVFFTRRKTINQNPDLVQQFVSSMAHGWEMAIANPVEAVQLLKSHDPANIDEDRELACFYKGLEYFKGENDLVMYASDHSWESFGNVLKMINRVDMTFNIHDIYDNSFINYYHQNK
jgi:ABC-type nitrate/sulfonate/bicarbonate transport system substrate-binding protein